MLKKSKAGIISVLLIFTQLMIAQNNTNSPYTLYRYGDLADRSFGTGRAMGGVGYGLRVKNQINPMNPASVTYMDSLTFLFDAGASIQFSYFKDGTNTQNDINGNIEYLAMQFKLANRLYMGLGMMPYSYVGYNFGAVDENEAGTLYSESYSGTGGLNQLYAGLGYELWKQRLSVGANVSYLFGDITHAKTIILSGNAFNSYRQQQYRIKDLKYDFGLQYTHPVSKTESFTLGLAFSPKIDVGTKYYETTLLQDASSSTIESNIDTIQGKKFGLPNSYGVGISYTKANKLMLAADFLYEEWKDVSFYERNTITAQSAVSTSTNCEFNNRYKIAVGGEFLPDHMSRNYFGRVKYRAGLHYGNSYLKIKDAGYDEYGASVGFGLPMVDGRSYINLGLEYVKRASSLIDEQYFRITINVNFNEFWFFKRKI